MEETPLNKGSKGNFTEMCSILAAKYNFMHEKKTTHWGDGKICEKFCNFVIVGPLVLKGRVTESGIHSFKEGDSFEGEQRD